MATGRELRWPREIELKLALAPRDHKAVFDHPLVRKRLADRPRRQLLESRYFDTPERGLRAQGAVFRVRRTGGGFVQTVKLTDLPRGALADRLEWSCPVESFAPRPDLLPAALAARIGLTGDTALEPLFETRFLRRTALLRWREAVGGPVELELALDRGAIIAGERRERISELELELRRGPRRAAFALAEALRRTVPLRLSAVDKAARSHVLAGWSPPPGRASRPPLEPTMSSMAAFARLLHAVLGHWLASEMAVHHSEDSEAVHQLRVALRRGVIAFALFRPLLPAAAHQRWREAMKGVLGSLAEMRELDVVHAELLATTGAPEEEGLGLLAERLDRMRVRARAATRKMLAAQDHGDLLLGLAAWLEREGWREDADTALLLRQDLPVVDHAARMLTRTHKRLARAGRDPGELDTAGRHELRLAAKRMRYAVEFFAPLYPGHRREPWSRRLRRLQDLLGEDNDLAAARQLLVRVVAAAPKRERTALARAAGFVLGWHRHRLRTLPRRLEKELDRLGSLRRYW